jgi:hypothetical protein
MQCTRGCSSTQRAVLRTPKHEAHSHMDGDVTDGAVYDNISHEISHNRW